MAFFHLYLSISDSMTKTLICYIVIEIKRPITKEKLDQALSIIRKNKPAKTSKKGLLKKYFGSAKKKEDALTLQKKMRNDWN